LRTTHKTAPASVGFQALQLGQLDYIVAITVFSGLLILLVLAEAIRTRGWKGLVDFDYMDLRNLIIAASRRGEGIAAAADYKGSSGNATGKRAETVALKIGRIRVVHGGPHLVFSGLGKLGKSRESL
jgi:hypothetical protein